MSRIKLVQPSLWRADGEAWGRARTNLYLIQEGVDGPVKVGVAGHPVRRLLALQTGNFRRLYLRAVFEGAESKCIEIEKYMLRYFNSAGGEWVFAEIDEILRVVSAFTDDSPGETA